MGGQCMCTWGGSACMRSWCYTHPSTPCRPSLPAGPPTDLPPRTFAPLPRPTCSEIPRMHHAAAGELAPGALTTLANQVAAGLSGQLGGWATKKNWRSDIKARAGQGVRGEGGRGQGCMVPCTDCGRL